MIVDPKSLDQIAPGYANQGDALLVVKIKRKSFRHAEFFQWLAANGLVPSV